jgi:hypothetical protein
VSAVASHHGRVASLTRSRNPDDPDLLAAKRDLRAARAEDYIRELAAAAPPLTAEQRDRLALLLRGPSSDTAA